MGIIGNREEVLTSVGVAIPLLREALGDRMITSVAVREHHSHGSGLPVSGLPDAVFMARTTEEVAILARICHEARAPIIPFGAGTSVEGHVAAIYGGICVDFSEMDALLSVSAESLDCRVQSGLRREQLNDQIRSDGLFFPVDPGGNASIGGMAGTRASGTAAVRYGTMRENVMGLTVVTPDGRIITTGGRARKSSAGLDLTKLYVGSEGTLGLITEVQLRLFGIPEAIWAAVCQFPSVQAAVDTAVTALQLGLPVARMELMNELQMRMSINYSKLADFEAKPTLFLEFHGSEQSVREQVETFCALASENGGGEFRYANLPEERSRLWKARHDAYYASKAYRIGSEVMGTDACVPISELAACILETEADVIDTGLPTSVLGHVGDGNFHLNIVYLPDDPDERRRAEGLAERVALRAIRLGGTCTGEHGIGTHKIELLETERGEAVNVMRAIKQALDPRGIMNPGKMLRYESLA
jgi:D-lactate dehydrogenase (cytochrome)